MAAIDAPDAASGYEAVIANTLELNLSAAVAGFSGPFLYYAGRRHLPAPLRAFIDFVKAPPFHTALGPR